MDVLVSNIQTVILIFVGIRKMDILVSNIQTVVQIFVCGYLDPHLHNRHFLSSFQTVVWTSDHSA